MSEWTVVAGLAFVAGAAIPAGAVLASFERIRPDWLDNEFRHSVIAFGGGVLFSAVALVLVPEGSENVPIWVVAASVSAGGVSFFLMEMWLAAKGTSASQLAAMLLDFIPEALALGATFAAASSSAPLLALLIALQNLPEGFNAYRELTVSGRIGSSRVMAAFAALSLLGPVAGLSGYFWLSAYPTAVSVIMLFAAGGILYLIFQDIAPQARLDRHRAPALGAVAGFLLGLIGEMVLTN